MSSSDSSERRRRPLRDALLVGALALGLLGALELAARALTAPPEPRWWLDVPTLGWRLRPDFVGEISDAQRAIDAQGLLSLDSGQAAAGRPGPILVLGDSRAFGSAVAADATFAEVLDRRLPAIDVLNLGVPGYSAVQGVERLRDEIPLRRPRAVIFGFGFNDRRSVERAAEVDEPTAFTRRARRLRRIGWIGRLRVVGALGSLVRGASGVDVTTLRPRVDPERYRRALDAAARLAAAHDVELILLQLGDHPRQAAPLELGERRAQGAPERAVAPLERAVALDNAFSDAARRRLVDIHRALGDAASADAVRHSPRRLRSLAGGFPILAENDYRRSVEDVAAAHGLVWIDAERALATHPDWFFDYCHFDARGHQRVAQLLERELRQRRLLV
ncbi:MAG: GDSL-type esterase/lipase family protein [Acidobacteriota bacterium]